MHPIAKLPPKLTDWTLRHPRMVIAFLLLLCLGPFLNKAVHIDDPLFVWTSEQIQKHPGDFYGFEVDWTGQTVPMSAETCNPPTTSYYLALVTSLFGGREMCWHGAMFLTTLAALTGIFQLAKIWCQRPLLATLITLGTPVFLVSATTLMCDLPMLACWIWSVVFWERGLSSGKAAPFFLAALLAGLAVLTKYSALTLLPLLPILGMLRQRRLGAWWLWLAVPVAMIEVYQIGTARLYGHGLISAAADYASRTRFATTGGPADKIIIGLAYAGGCLLPVLWFAARLWTRRFWVLSGLWTLTAIGAMLWLTDLGHQYDWGFRLQLGLLLAVGLLFLLLTARELWRRHDATTLLLFLWLGSGLLFATALNWTVSARSFLPLAPALAILVVRGLPDPLPGRESLRALFWPLAGSLLFSLAIATADDRLAESQRVAAHTLAARYGTGHPLWFEGHCGFQYYLQKTGARPVDFNTSTLQPGDLLIVPSNNSNLIRPPAEDTQLLETAQFKTCSWLSTVRATTGAGFYGAGGLLPFVFGPVPVEKYYVCRVVRPLCFAPPEILNNTAWQLATSPDATLRNGPRAVALAQRACEQTQYKTTVFMGTLAAAYAEAGQFDQAIVTAQKACALAAAHGETDLLQRNQELLTLYQRHQPWHEADKE